MPALRTVLGTLLTTPSADYARQSVYQACVSKPHPKPFALIARCFKSRTWEKDGWGGRIRTCECRYQKPVPYHLATPQQAPANAGESGAYTGEAARWKPDRAGPAFAL